MDNMIYRRTKTVALFKDKSQMDLAINDLKDAGIYDIHTKKIGHNCQKTVKEEAFLTRNEIMGTITGIAMGGLTGMILAYLIGINLIYPPLLIPASTGRIYVLLYTGLTVGAILGGLIASIASMILPYSDAKEGDYLLTVYYISPAKKKVIGTLKNSLCIII